uniref:hypothetical protein n=1 Tax=Eshraghiella crossota TaxID=45851 RepID=UPI004027B5FA
MKKIKVVMCICLAAVIISGCSDKGKSQKDSNPSGQDFVLTEEQKNYLSDKKGIGTAALELMNKESINWNLLGTGFELYNKTSGVETNGVEYIADNSYDYQKSNDIDRKITFDEAVSFRNEDTKMRIEALSGYRYEITEAEEYRKLQAPISGYDDTYLTIFFKVSDNKVFMKVPYIEYSGPDNDSNFAFSLLYDRDYIKAFFENNDYSLNDKLVYGIQYTSVTDCSVVLRITNYTEDSYIFNGEATVYRVDDSGNIITESAIECTSKPVRINSLSFSIIPVSFANIAKGEYTIIFGKDEAPNIYGRLNFSL